MPNRRVRVHEHADATAGVPRPRRLRGSTPTVRSELVVLAACQRMDGRFMVLATEREIPHCEAVDNTGSH